ADSGLIGGPRSRAKGDGVKTEFSESINPQSATRNPQYLIPDGAKVFVMPDFRGRGVRAVTQACAQMNLVIRMHGSGLAYRQSPAAGSKVRAGETCKVDFQ